MNVRIQNTLRFMAGIHYAGKLAMNEYTIKVYMMTNTHDPAESGIAFDRIKHFIYSQLENTVFINGELEDECKRYLAAGVNVTTLPGDPVDQLIGVMLYYKITAMVEGRMIIGEVESSSALGEGIIYMHGENENVEDIDIPSWWHTPDLTHCDDTFIDSDKVVAMHQSGVWRDLDLGWPDSEDITETGNTVVFADFKKSDDTK
jgi:hypothetical protein